MRRFFLCIVFVTGMAICAPREITESSYEDAESGSLENRFAAYTALSVAGYAVSAVGIGLIISGFAALAEDDVDVDSRPGGVSFHADDKEDLRGPVRLIVGFPVGIGGVILGTIGLKRARTAKAALNAVHAWIDPVGGIAAIGVTSRF
jgi:hypothetical protein